MRKYPRETSLKWLFCALVAAATTNSLAADRDVSAKGTAYFETHIRPLLAEHCYQCHSSRAHRQEGGLLLDTRMGWSQGGENGPAVIAGNADASLLIQAVRYTNPDLQMPPEKRLSQAAIGQLERWIRTGAVDPRDEATIETTHYKDPSDPIAGREHWAYRRLETRSPPDVVAADWPRSTVDSYILRELEAASLRPAPDADRRDLVRRVYVQLIGLPPSPSQTRSFVEDRSPDAFARLVDRLLSSQHFGERWGRHWLDLARYADSNGLDENFLFREAWRYRNWVIDAVSADIPFDQFVIEQIAGDLLGYDSTEQRDRQRIAAGFLVLGPKVLLGNDEKKQRMEVADEQLDTIGRAILGQTLGCARCHDHKFDPVPTSDYYAMAGILTSTRVVERRYMLGQQRVMERLVGLGPDGEQLDEAYEKYWREQPSVKERRNHAKSALEFLEKDDDEALQKHVKDHPDAVSEEASDAGLEKEKRLESQTALIAQLDRIIANPQTIPPRAMIPSDAETPQDEHVRLAGQFDRLGQQVPRGFLTVLCDSASGLRDRQSGRVELSRWLTDVDHGAGNLSARVLANRVWHHLIGRGLVRTVDNFGRTGEAATHPELLDHLAHRLIETGWSIKELVRTIVLSRTFAISCDHVDADLQQSGQAIDPENRLLWRAHRRRLSPEALRDSMLAAADQLDLTPMESSVWYLGDQATAVGANKNRRRTDFPCRSVYLPVIRNDLPELFDVFDFADPHTTTGARSDTTVAMQGLYMLNAEAVMDAAEATARRVLGPAIKEPSTEKAAELSDQGAQVDRMCELILGIRPAGEQRDELLNFILETQQRLADRGEDDARLRAWSLACHALFASSRFQIVE